MSKRLAVKEKTSYLFRKETLEILENNKLDDEYYYVSMLKLLFCKNFHTLTNQSSRLIYANIILPIAFQMGISNFEIGGTVPLEFDRAKVIPKHVYKIAVDIFNQINIVLAKVIPGLTVELNNLGRETDANGEEGVCVELLSNRSGIKFPFWCDSDGIKKLFSILSTLITMFNKSKKRYIKLAGVKKQTNNLRNIYFRVLQLGGQTEEVYQVTDAFYLRKAFRNAGEIQ